MNNIAFDSTQSLLNKASEHTRKTLLYVNKNSRHVGTKIFWQYAVELNFGGFIRLETCHHASSLDKKGKYNRSKFSLKS